MTPQVAPTRRRRLLLVALIRGAGAILSTLAPHTAWALQNGLARTPPMGWNSYNKFGGNVTESQVKAIADAFVSQGLLAAGYQYIVVDYCWSTSRDASGQMVPVASKFPSGMKSLGDYIHGKGLKFGMYQSPTKVTCCNEPGSYQHEQSDAQQFASWGVDYLKYDWCGVQSKENGTVTAAQVESRYTAMRDAIQATSRPMLYALCEKGQGAKGVQPATWSEPVGNIWRISNDISATWSRILSNFDTDATLASYAKPGGWNDPDILEVGNGSLTEAQNRAHFSLWSIVAAPLLLGNDPSNMTAAIKTIVTNADVIAVDQDPLGKQGTRVAMSGQTEAWAKPMRDGSVAVVLFNRGASTASVSVTWSAIGVTGSSRIHDLWSHTDVGTSASGYSAMVPSNDVVMIRVYPPGSGDGGAPLPDASVEFADALAPVDDTQETGAASDDATVAAPAPEAGGSSGVGSAAGGASAGMQGGSSSGDAVTGAESATAGSNAGSTSGASTGSGVSAGGAGQTGMSGGAAPASDGCACGLRATQSSSASASAGVAGWALGLWFARRRLKRSV